MYCESCLLKDKSSLFPSGAFNPDYYILGDVATQAELEANQVFSITTPAGQYLNNVCQSIGMTQDNTRLFKIVRCAPDYYSNSEDLSARENCHHYAFMDIFKTSPKIIITLGREASKVLLGDRATAISTIRGRIYEVMIEGQIYRVMPTFSPNFIVNNPSQSEQFVNDLLHAMSYVKGDLIDIGKKELLYAKNYEEFYNYYEDKLKDKLIISFDLETNARDSRSQDARMVGFSMAPDGSSGIYIVRESLEYKMPAEDWNKITELAKSILSEKTSLIHNTMYEVPFTYNEWGFYIENFIDTLIKARLLLGGKIGAGLKDRCILDLGYPDWDHDLDEYRAGFTTLLSKLKPTSSGSARWDFTHMKNRGLASLYDEYASEIENGRELDKRCNACYEAINKIRNVILKYYTSDTDYSIIIELISDEIVALIDVDYNGPFSYGFIPLRIITKYGAMDSVATQDLNIYLDKKLEEYSNQLGINLKNGYEYMRRHYVAGTWMEMNGLYWNDEVANQEKKWYEDQCFKTSLAMIDSPFLDNMLFNEQQWMLNDYIVENHLDLVRQILGNFYIMKSGIKLESTGELIRYKRLLERLGPSFANQYRSVLLNLVRQKARTHNHYTELKYIFNPASPKQSMKDTLNSIFITPEIQIAHFMNKLNVMLDDGDFNIEKYPPSDRPLFRVLLDCRNYNKYIDDYNNLDESAEDTEILARIESMEEKLDITDDEQEVEEGNRKRVKLTKGDTFRRFAATLAETRIQSRELTRSASESMNYHLDSISENNIIEINTYYCITGVDVDDQSTWTDRYKFLVNFRIWKKCNKMITTYIDGAKVGRGSVWIVDKNSLESGDTLTRRKRLYDGNVHEDETCLMQPTYKVCTASSFRWQAGMHCLHPDTEIILTDGRNIKVSELHEEFRSGKKNYVYSLQKQSDGIGYRFIVDSIKDVYISYYANNMVRVHLDNGKYFEVTPDHKMIRRNGEYVEAQDLVEGDKLYPFRYRNHDIEHLELYNPDYNEYVPTYRLAVEACIRLSNKITLGCRYKDINFISMDYSEVVKVEKIYYEEAIPVYSIAINPNNPSFPLSCGVMSKNTIPAESSIKNIYTSRYKGGCIAAPDFCLDGSTKIRLADGSNVPIRDLVGLDEFYVYSYDESDRKIKIGRGHDCRLVRYADDMYEVTLESGETIRCTSNHKFFNARTEQMQEIKDMKVGDSLLPLNFSKYNEHGVYHKDRECVIDPWSGEQLLTHYMADDYNLRHEIYNAESGSDRHHKDFNKLNNDPRNIQRLSRADHVSIHQQARVQNPDYIAQLRLNTKKQWTSPEFRELMHNIGLGKPKESLLKSNSDPRCIELRRNAKITKTKNRLHEVLVLMKKNGIVPSEHTWDECLSRLSEVPRGCKIRAIYHAYGNFPNFIVNEQDNYPDDYSKEYIDAITFKVYFENRTNGRTLSTIFRVYKLCKELNLPTENAYDWDLAVKHLRGAKRIGKYDGLSSGKIISIFKNFDNFNLYCINNHKIVKITKLNEFKVPVYCFTVDEFHNFFLSCGVLSANSQMELRTMAGASKCTALIEAFRNGADIHLQNASKIFKKAPEEVTAAERRYAKMSSFMILYGGDYHSFGKEFLDGDIALAKSIYDSFYEAYPEVADYIAAKHEEMRRQGKVTTLMDMFINISPDDDVCRGDEGKALRLAQNSCIQSAASMIAGCCLYEIMKFIRQNNFKSKIILFVHDSIEIDIHPAEMLQLASQIIPMMNKFPNEQFNMPVKADLVLGKSIGQEVTIEEIKCNDDFTEGEMICEAEESSFNALIDEWRKVYKSVTWEDISESKQKYRSYSQLFISKLAIQRGGYDVYYNVVHRKVKVII